jgi:hypothetical protein
MKGPGLHRTAEHDDLHGPTSAFNPALGCPDSAIGILEVGGFLPRCVVRPGLQERTLPPFGAVSMIRWLALAKVQNERYGCELVLNTS